MATHHGTIRAQSGWVIGFTTFAGVIMAISGSFQFFEGLAAILNPNYFVVGHNYAYYVNATTWGWINLIVGAIVALAGFYVFTGSLWARIVGITLAVLSAIANFFYIPYYPVWSLLIIALDISVIWALSVYNRPVDEGYDAA
jgi:hypothetical protein